MASSSAPLQEWLVIIPDHTGALDKRLAVRPKHIEGLKADREDMWLWGGMLLYLWNTLFGRNSHLQLHPMSSDFELPGKY